MHDCIICCLNHELFHQFSQPGIFNAPAVIIIYKLNTSRKLNIAVKEYERLNREKNQYWLEIQRTRDSMGTSVHGPRDTALATLRPVGTLDDGNGETELCVMTGKD